MAVPSFSNAIGARIKSVVFALAHSGPLVAFAAHTRKYVMPESGIIVGVSTNVGAKGGTHSTSTATVKNGSSTVVAVDVAAAVAATPVDSSGSVANTTIAKGAELSVVLAESGGSSPTYSDTDLVVHYVPTGD